ncbi:MAG: ComEC/Rec2 family competence protein [Actinomycetes bacterium]
MSRAAVLGGALAVVAVLVACRRTPTARVICAAGLAAATGLGIAALRAPATAAHMLEPLARDHPSVTAELVVTGDPQVTQSRSARGRFLGALVLVPASVRRLRVDNRDVRLRAAVLVLAHGDRWRTLLPSQRLTAIGILLPARSGDTVAFALSARGPPATVGPPSLVQRVAGRLRAGLRAAAYPLPGDERGLLPGLVDGDVSALPDRVRAEFRVTGLTHLVAVSGANVAIVAAAAFALARGLRLGLRGRAVLATAAIVGFVVLARPSPSVLRAAVMGSLGLAALATGRLRAGVPALAAAVLLLVLAEPALATADGFVLSVLATGGLLLVAPRLRDRFLPHMPRWAAESLAVAVAAQLMTAPYIAVRFARVSMLSVPANLLAAPAVPPATVLGVVAATVAPVCVPLARAVAALAYLPTAWLAGVARIGAGVPGASISWPRGVPGLLLLAAAGLVVVGIRWRRRVRRWPSGPADRHGAAHADRR